jgi:hypothetical protein
MPDNVSGVGDMRPSIPCHTSPYAPRNPAVIGTCISAEQQAITARQEGT